jgi:long-chain acyl-CoA synthetase
VTASLPRVLRERARAAPGGIALRRKALGIWEQTTWAELDERVARVALGLAGAGVSAGDTVALVGDNSPDWIVADLALQAVGARCAAAWPTLGPAELNADLRRAGATLAICGDEEAYDKVEGLRTILIDATGVDGETTLAALAEAGAGEPLERYEALLSDRAGDDEVCLAFGADGERPLVAFSAGALAAAASAAAAATELTAKDRAFCLLELAALPARVLDVYAPLLTGATIHVPESAASVPADLVEVAPTVLSASPRALELLRAATQVRGARSRRFKRRLMGWAAGHSNPLSRYAVIKPAARLFGLGAVRRITCIGGPLTDVMRGHYATWGARVAVLEGGAAEGQIALIDGRPLPGVSAGVTDGRLVASAPWSGRVVDGGGEVLARERDGAIEVLGSAGDVVGESVLPELEARLRDSPYFTEAALVAGRGGLVAHVGLDADAASVWAARHGVHAPTAKALAAEPAVQELAREEVERLVPGVVASVVVLPRRLSLAAGELTPLLDVRREGIAA